MNIQAISAVTLKTADMPRAVAFYASLGLIRHRGGPDAAFTTFAIGAQHLNLRRVESSKTGECKCLVILGVESADEMHARMVELGHSPEFAPRNADWGERYFHIRDPDGHLLSFAEHLPPAAQDDDGGKSQT